MKSKQEIKKQTRMFTTNRVIRRLVVVAGCIVLFFSDEIMAQDGATLFKQNCAVCHRTTKAKMVGPGLEGITEKRSQEWLLKWTKSSQTLINSGDADAKAIFDEYNGLTMPDQAHLSDDDIKSIYSFIASQGSAAPVASAETKLEEEVLPDASNNASPEVVELGKNIFIGSQRLENGGPSCISCHNVNYVGVIPGGLLAKDLTTVYSRLGGDAGLLGMLGAPPFPAMMESYKNNPITENEIAAIIAFLNKVDKDKPNQQVSTVNYLLYGGLVVMCALLTLILIIWYNRKKHTVKKNIYDRQIKSI